MSRSLTYETDPNPVPVDQPNAAGWWMWTFTNSVVRVVDRKGELWFPADQWAEEEVRVTDALSKGSRPKEWLRVHPVIDLEPKRKRKLHSSAF